MSPIPRGSGDLRQRRHGSRVRPLPRVALGANQRSWEGFGHSGGATSAAASQPIPRQHNRHRATGNPSTLINSISWKGNMNTLYYPTLTHLVHNRDGPPTYFGESRTGLSDRLDQSSHHLPTSASTRPSLDESTRGRKKVASTAGVIITRLLALLVVAMVVTSILGFTLFDRQEGTSATALREPGHRRRRGRTWLDLRFPRGPPSELRDQTGETPPAVAAAVMSQRGHALRRPTSGRPRMHGGRRSTKLTCPLVFSTRYPFSDSATHRLAQEEQ